MRIHVNYGGGRGEWIEIPDPEVSDDLSDEGIEARLAEIYGVPALEAVAARLRARKPKQRERDAS